MQLVQTLELLLMMLLLLMRTIVIVVAVQSIELFVVLDWQLTMQSMWNLYCPLLLLLMLLVYQTHLIEMLPMLMINFALDFY